MTLMTEIKSQKVEFVDVVNAEGKPIADFTSPVPASWIGTDLLPEGAKKAPAGSKEEAPEESSRAAELDARAAELDAREADLTKREEALAASPTPEGDGDKPAESVTPAAPKTGTKAAPKA